MQSLKIFLMVALCAFLLPSQSGVNSKANDNSEDVSDDAAEDIDLQTYRTLLGGGLAAAYTGNELSEHENVYSFMPKAKCPHLCVPDRVEVGKEDCSKCTLYRFMPPATCSECNAVRPCNKCAGYKFMPVNECKLEKLYTPAPAPAPTVPAPILAPTPTPAPTEPVVAPVIVSTNAPATKAPTTKAPTTKAPTTKAPITQKPTSKPTPKPLVPTPAPFIPKPAPGGKYVLTPAPVVISSGEGLYPQNKQNVGGASTAKAASSSGLSAGAIAGIVIGCIALVAVVAFVVIRKYKSKQREEQMFNEPTELENPESSGDYAAM